MKFLFSFLFLTSLNAKAQSFSINTDGSVADTSAILDVKSPSKGILVPRITKTQINSIFQPAVGLLVYQTDKEKGFYFYNGIKWSLLLTTSTQDNTLIYTTKGF